jgi:hypothetical protein
LSAIDREVSTTSRMSILVGRTGVLPPVPDEFDPLAVVDIVEPVELDFVAPDVLEAVEAVELWEPPPAPLTTECEPHAAGRIAPPAASIARRTLERPKKKSRCIRR